jgi:hypothetical protein
VSVAVRETADGTFVFDVPQDVEGEVRLWVVAADGRTVSEATFVVDTKAPEVLRVDNVERPTTAPAPAPKGPEAAAPRARKFFQVSGSDGGSGIKAMQIAPRDGVTWAWRSFVERFSAPLRRTSVRVRIVDRAGNVSPWFTVRITRS